jgi:hypothetical protein
MSEIEDQVESPFMPRKPVRLGFGTMLILLLMVVSAGIGLLFYYALRVPAITGELNAWLGRTNPSSAPTDARQAQVIFAMFLYASPMALGILVWVLHLAVNWVDRRNATSKLAKEDEIYRME